jgi:DNA helicase-2/ATP-dependent DNA helicase PcrA
LKFLVNPSDEVALLRIINTPTRGIGKTTIDKVRAYAALHNISFFDGLKKTGDIDSLSKAPKAKIAAFVNMIEQFKNDVTGKVAPVAKRVFTESGLEKSLRACPERSRGDVGEEGKNALENVTELISAAAQYDKQAEEPSLLDYLQQISLFSDVDAYDAISDRVALMTLHAAKGLEFENVFIIGLEDGLLPHERGADDEDELEEERRLFFVGITRAKSGLYISCARYRTIRGQLLRTIPSQFLFELGTDFSESDNTTPAHPPVIPAQAGIHSPTPSFAPGQLVQHKFFGLGTVEEFIDMGENSVIVVKFNTGQTKSLMLKYAGLTEV